uniref:CCHC-type domain-containing protein n=2 Tax=Cyprinus carpio carpio TaxID=630221 RepID=A0A9J8C808_CYPCA
MLSPSCIKLRVYPGTSIEDGTRYVKTRFPKEVASLPYSTKIETAEGPQYFRVMHSHQVKTCWLCMSPDHVVKDCPEFKCYKCEERGHFARNCNAVTCPDCNLVLNKCECWMEGEEEEEQQVGRQVQERDNEQREDETSVRDEGQSNNNTEQQKECNEQDIQTQQDGGIWTQMDLTDSLQNALDTVELDDQRNKELSDAQQEGNLWTQMDVADSLQKVMDAVELNDQSNEKQYATKESEKGKENEETQGKSSKRRRSVKVIPNLDTARKRVLKEDGIECTNKYELLKGLEEMD